MGRPIEEILQEIRQFDSVHSTWLELDDLLAELWQSPQLERSMDDLFKLLEKFPEEDGAGVLWSVVHGVESLPNYELTLLKSLQRQPSHLGLIMLSRSLNTGVTQIGNTPITEILNHVLGNEKTTQVLRDEVEKIRKKIKQKL